MTEDQKYVIRWVKKMIDNLETQHPVLMDVLDIMVKDQLEFQGLTIQKLPEYIGEEYYSRYKNIITSAGVAL
jgi:hypothetical protein